MGIKTRRRPEGKDGREQIAVPIDGGSSRGKQFTFQGDKS